MDREDLTELKYRQLQKIAKANGLKANLPKEGLINAIIKYRSETAGSEGPVNNVQKDTSSISSTDAETTISSQSSCSEAEQPDAESDVGETKKLNETFEVLESSILTNDEDVMKPKNKSISEFSTPPLLNASDRFEQFFGLEDEHIPLFSSGASPKQYTHKHDKSKGATPSSSILINGSINVEPPLQMKKEPKIDVFTRLSSVPIRRNSSVLSCTPNVSTKTPRPAKSALKG